MQPAPFLAGLHGGDTVWSSRVRDGPLKCGQIRGLLTPARNHGDKSRCPPGKIQSGTAVRNGRKRRWESGKSGGGGHPIHCQTGIRSAGRPMGRGITAEAEKLPPSRDGTLGRHRTSVYDAGPASSRRWVSTEIAVQDRWRRESGILHMDRTDGRTPVISQ